MGTELMAHFKKLTTNSVPVVHRLNCYVLSHSRRIL